MDSEEERVLYLSRVGRDKIFKYGTYNMVTERPITQDHPFYVARDPGQKISYIPPEQAQQQAAAPAQSAPAPEPAPAAPANDDPEALAAAVISSNFKVGLSQEEVDALLNGMA